MVNEEFNKANSQTFLPGKIIDIFILSKKMTELACINKL